MCPIMHGNRVGVVHTCIPLRPRSPAGLDFIKIHTKTKILCLTH